jgi:hypothetical protein
MTHWFWYTSGQVKGLCPSVDHVRRKFHKVGPSCRSDSLPEIKIMVSYSPCIQLLERWSLALFQKRLSLFASTLIRPKLGKILIHKINALGLDWREEIWKSEYLRSKCSKNVCGSLVPQPSVVRSTYDQDGLEFVYSKFDHYDQD